MLAGAVSRWGARAHVEPSRTKPKVIRVELKRVYSTVDPADGARVLVDRLWPRGISKQKAQLTAWMKDAAPSHELRSWFDHDPAKWEEFRRRYFAELREAPEAVETLLNLAARGTLTLIHASRNEEFNNAVALREYLITQAGKHASSHGSEE